MAASSPSGTLPPAAGPLSLSRVAWLPVPLFLLAIIALKLDEPKAAFEHPYLLLLLNVVFSLVASGFVIALLARTFVMYGTADLLLFGCGLSFWALAGLVAVGAALALDGRFDNTLVTVHNLCVWLAGAAQLGGAALTVRPGALIRRTGLWLTAGHVFVVALVGVVVIASMAGWTPAFFIPGRGGTVLRQTLMYSASAMFGTAAVLVLRPLVSPSSGSTDRRRPSGFESWYAAALALIAVGLLGVTLQTVVGGPLGWVGRSAQFLSGIYLVVAAVAAVRQSRLWGLPLALMAREAAERYQRLFDTGADGTLICGLDGRILEVNDAYCRMSGYSRDEIVGMAIGQLEAAETPEPIASPVRKVLVAGGQNRFECRHRRKDGTAFDVDVTAVYLRVGDGQIAISARDVTDRNRAEETLRASEERHRTLFEAMTEGFALHEIVTDDRGRPCDYRFLQVNRAFERLTGLKAADLIGKRVLEVLPGIEPDWIDRYGRVAQTGEPARFESQSAALGRWYEVFAYRCAPGQFAAVFSDITARKQSEKALAEALARADTGDRMLTALMEHVPEGITIADSTGRVQMVSRRGRDLLGRSPVGESPAQAASEWTVCQPDGVTPLTAADLPLARALKGEVVQDVELVRVGASGRKLPLLCSAAPIRDAAGGVVGGITAWRDITERKRIEQALRDSEERLRLAQRSARVGIWDWNPTSGTLSWTPELERLYGFAEGAFPGTYAAFRDRVHPDDVAEMERRTDEALRAHQPFDFDFRVLSSEGETTWVNCKGAAVYDEAGRPQRVFGVNVDITERKRAEELARERLAEIEELYRNAPVGLCVLDRDLRWVRINDRLAEINGIPAAEHIGRRVRELMPALADAVEPEMRRVLETGEPRLDAEIVGETPAQPGVERSWLEHWLPLRDAAGRVAGLSIVVEETTERRRAAEALRRLNADLELRVAGRTAELARAVEEVRAERQRLLEVLDTLPVMVTLIRPDFQVPFANRAWRDALGEPLGRTCYQYQLGRDTPCEECQTFIPLQTGQPHRWEWSRPGGPTLDIHCFPFTDADGSPMILEMDIDITEQRRAERELRVAHAELAARAEQLRRVAGELTLAEQRERRRLAKVLHDHLQQLLAAARLRTAILGRSGDGLVAQAASEIKELLDLSIEAARSLTAELSPPILFEGGLGVALEWLARWMADKHDLVVDLSVEGSLPSLLEDVKVLLFESVRELLFNAVKHAHVRTVGVNVSRVDGEGLQITVSDSGPGFDPAALAGAGGFGLFSIRERLNLIAGRFEIDSSPGSGSRFKLVVPLGRVTVAETPPAVEGRVQTSARPSLAGPSGEGDSPRSGRRIRVLLADDHALMREGLARLLGEEPDIEVVGQAPDGREALRLAATLLPDLVLMDMSMPRLNGVEATRAIRSEFPGIRIIGLSMFEEAERAQTMRDAGAECFLTKGGPVADLLTAIRGGTDVPSPARESRSVDRRPAGRRARARRRR